MKKIILLFLLLNTTTAIASQNKNVIFKCVDSHGDISYLNGNIAKNYNCLRTELADVDKYDTVTVNGQNNNQKKNIPSSVSSSKNMVTTTGEIISNDEQKIRETKRDLVLKNELNDENEQLSSVNAMLQKITTKDSDQYNQLKDMQNTHNQNIASLEKELGINTSKKLIIVNTKK
jgi:vacuolar-type H+-ATPase subunit I/STV1